MSFSPGEGKQWHTWHKDRRGVCFRSFFLLCNHMYGAHMINDITFVSHFISSETSSDVCQFYRISQSVWIVFCEQTKTLIRSASMRQFKVFFFSSRGQKHSLPDGSLAVSMYPHLFLNLFLPSLSQLISNITSYSVPLGNKSNLETWQTNRFQCNSFQLSWFQKYLTHSCAPQRFKTIA